MREYRRQTRPRILVVDVGGTHVKLQVTGLKEPIEILSGPTLTAKAMVRKVKAALKDLPYDVVSIGYPGPVIHGRPLREPYNLGGGWVGFDFRKAFGRGAAAGKATPRHPRLDSRWGGSGLRQVRGPAFFRRPSLAD